jgi:hypothetical protein
MGCSLAAGEACGPPQDRMAGSTAARARTLEEGPPCTTRRRLSVAARCTRRCNRRSSNRPSATATPCAASRTTGGHRGFDRTCSLLIDDVQLSRSLLLVLADEMQREDGRAAARA